MVLHFSAPVLKLQYSQSYMRKISTPTLDRFSPITDSEFFVDKLSKIQSGDFSNLDCSEIGTEVGM